MNWKLIFQLSMFGLAMALATVFLIPANTEPVFWLPILLISAYLIGKRTLTRRFSHGLLLGLLNSVWVTSAHLIFFNRYAAGHTQELAMLRSASPGAPGLIMAITGPVAGLFSGIIIGLLALAAGKLVGVKKHNDTHNQFPACGGVIDPPDPQSGL